MVMNKLICLLIASFCITAAIAQDTLHLKTKKKMEVIDRAGDHFMFQLSSDHLGGAPDSIKSHLKGFSRGFNAYLMLDKPFRGNPKMSLAFGIGVGSSNIFFQKMKLDITNNTSTTLPFVAEDSSNHFKKYKMAVSYLEIPVELRYSANPAKNGKSFKFAIGGKIGTLLNAHVMGKTLQDKNNNTIDSYKEKEISKKYFNSTRLCGTVRIGYGIVSLFGNYQFTSLLKTSEGATMNIYQIGLSFSGL